MTQPSLERERSRSGAATPADDPEASACFLTSCSTDRGNACGTEGNACSTEGVERLSSEDLRDAVTAMERAFVTIDPAGLITFANVRAAAILESTPDALVGRPVADVLVCVDRLRAAHQREDASGECHYRRRDGDQRTLAFTVSSVDTAQEGAPVSQIVVFRDVTEIVQLREERDRLLRMATVGELMPTLLHEIRNPIAAITASLELAIEEAADQTWAEYLHAILTEARRVAVSLNSLGASTGTLLAAEPAPIDHSIREACRLLSAKAAKSGVTITADVSDMPLLPVDAGTLRACLLNLLNNAIQACSTGDTIYVAAHLDRDRQALDIRIEDTGQGMTGEVLNRCTELFFTTKRSGSGIGLALTRRLVEEARGSFHVSSMLGVGTTVTLSIPLGEIGDIASPKAAAPGASMQPQVGVSWLPPPHAKGSLR